MSTFKERIKQMLSGRALTAWAKSIPLSGGTYGRITQNKIPGLPILNVIQKVENVSTAWLVDGIGSPFITHQVANDVEGAEYLLALLDENDWEIFVFYNDVHFYVVMTQPATLDFKGKQIPYPVLEVITGTLGEQCALILQAQKDLVSYANIPNDILAMIGKGETGTYILLGDDKSPGLVDMCDVLPDDHQLPTSSNDENTILLNKINALSSDQKKQILGLVDSLLKT